MSIEHWMMFGTFAEQRHFVYPTKTAYDGAIINANMAAHAPGGLAAFLLEKTDSLRYIIDPLTHAFQHDPDFVTDSEGKPKTSIKLLADAYGDPLKSTLGVRPLLPKDLNDDRALLPVVKNCIAFQMNQLADAMAASDAMKYLDVPQSKLRPYALIAPYFYMTETTYRAWLPVCVRAATMARDIKGDAKIFGSVVVSQGVILNPTACKQIADGLGPLGLDGYLLWVDDLDEQVAGGAELGGLVALARALRANGHREVINLHGGYFSVLAAGVLGNSAMSGVTHGPEFGEHRSVVPVGGGIPIARYYIPQVHARIRYRDAVRFLRTKGWMSDAKVFFKQVCACDECKTTIGNDIARFTQFGEGVVKSVRRGGGIVRIEYPTMQTKLHCLRHYLNRKQYEYSFAATASREQILGELETGGDDFRDVMGLDGVGHLELWRDTLALF